MTINTVRAKPLLGTLVEIKVTTCPNSTRAHVHHCIDQAFAAIAQVQQLMSFHHADSQLSLLNRLAFQQPVQVHPWVYAVLLRAKKIFSASLGLFDCTVADALVEWSILPRPCTADIATTSPVSQADIQLLPNGWVKYNRPLWVDLGGIAKGFAVDIAIHTLRRLGVTAAVINAGGDLRVLGNHPETIYIKSPSAINQLICVGELSAGAFATSGIYYSERVFQEQTVSALVNPMQRQPITSPYSFSVLAPTAWLADALTKVIAITQNTQHACLKPFGAQAFILH